MDIDIGGIVGIGLYILIMMAIIFCLRGVQIENCQNQFYRLLHREDDWD